MKAVWIYVIADVYPPVPIIASFVSYNLSLKPLSMYLSLKTLK